MAGRTRVVKRKRGKRIIVVPEVPAPKGRCWQQHTDLQSILQYGKPLARCGLVKGHGGPHAWGGF